MMECVLAWFFLIVSACTNEPSWAIVSALFAVAMHLGDLVKAKKRGGNHETD